jgi:hypothetical protein
MKRVGAPSARSCRVVINCTCGSRTAVGVLSFARPKESTQRKGRPGGRKRFLRSSGSGPSPSHSTSLYCVSGADSLSAPLTGSPRTLAVLEARPTGARTKATTEAELIVDCSCGCSCSCRSIPVKPAEHRSRHRETSRDDVEPERALFLLRAGEFGSRSALSQERRGEAGKSRMHLTCIRAAERRATEGAAGVERRCGSRAMDGRRDDRQVSRRSDRGDLSLDKVAPAHPALRDIRTSLYSTRKVTCVCCTGMYEFRGSAGCAGAMSTTHKLISYSTGRAKRERSVWIPASAGMTAAAHEPRGARP